MTTKQQYREKAPAFATFKKKRSVRWCAELEKPSSCIDTSTTTIKRPLTLKPAMKLRLPPPCSPPVPIKRSGVPVFKMKRYHIGGSVKGTTQQRPVVDPIAKIFAQFAEQHTNFEVGSVVLKGTHWLPLHERLWMKELDTTIKENMKLVLTSRESLHAAWEERCERPKRLVRELRERERREFAAEAWNKSQMKEERVYSGVREEDLQLCEMPC